MSWALVMEIVGTFTCGAFGLWLTYAAFDKWSIAMRFVWRQHTEIKKLKAELNALKEDK